MMEEASDENGRAMIKTLYMLIGPKGAGKTYIGTRIGQLTNITFLAVEPLWVKLQPGEDGWQMVAATIAELFRENDKIMIESLGAGKAFQAFYAALTRQYIVKMIRVRTDLTTCLERVRKRSRQEHIPVSEEQVALYNALAATVVYDWAAVIDNNGPATDAEILALISALAKDG